MEKNFQALVKETALERKMTMGEAMRFCVKNFGDKYKEYREKTLGVFWVDDKQQHLAS